MSEVTIDARILMNCHTEAEWQTTNPIPKNRELCISTDKNYGLYKIGDGVHTWSQLPYVLQDFATGTTQNKTTANDYNLLFTSNEVLEGEYQPTSTSGDLRFHTYIKGNLTKGSLIAKGYEDAYYTDTYTPVSDDPLEVLPPITQNTYFPVAVSSLMNEQKTGSSNEKDRVGVLTLKNGNVDNASSMASSQIIATTNGGVKISENQGSTSGVTIRNNGTITLTDSNGNTLPISVPASDASTVYLRGDGTWSTVSGGSGSSLQNLVDGSATGSVRGIGTTAESDTYTIGSYAFSEGYYTKASGNYSHAEGEYTTSQRKSQTTIGRYNILDTTNSEIFNYGSYAFIIGNGTADDARSNALTVDWDGNVTATTFVQSSDKRLKDNIESLDNNYERFFMNLQPSTFTLKQDETNKTHIGFIAQDVEQALINSELTKDDFAGLVTQENGEDESYYLCYDEFISLNTHMIQKLYQRIEQLEDRIKELESSTAK